MAEVARPAPLSTPRAALARARVFTTRLRVARWVFALTVAGAVALWTASATSDTARARDEWGSAVDVWVTTRAIEAGTPIARADVEARSLPAAAVPDEAVAAAEEPVGHRVRTDLASGEVLVAARIAPGSASPAAARLPAATRGVVVRDIDPEAFNVGDRADLHDLTSGCLLVADAVVTELTADGTMFAVDAGRVTAVVAAFATGGVIATLAG